MEADECGLTRGTSFVARRLEVVAVAGLLWISWCASGGAGFRSSFFRFLYSYFERTRSAASMRPPCLIYLTTSTGVCTRSHFLINLSVTFVVFTDSESCTRPIST